MLLAAGLAASLSFLLLAPGRAEAFELRELTDNVDVALGAGKNPTGELMAAFALGPLDLGLQHIEYMEGMSRPWLYGKPTNNPLARSSLAKSQAQIELAPALAMPLGISFGLDEWEQGNRNVRLITSHGLHLPHLRLDHRVTVTNSFSADGSKAQRSAGRLVLGFDLFGGRHEGVAEYNAAPLAQTTHLRMNSRWALGGGSAAILGLTHQPLPDLSEARLGFRQPLGPFALTSDVMADSAGGYGVGLQFSVPLGASPKREAWSLSALAASLRAERQPTALAGSDAYAFADES